MRSGYLRKRFTLLGIEKDANGDPIRDAVGQLSTVKKVISRPWCAVTVISSSENTSSSGTVNQLTLEFTVRWSKQFENPTAEMEILFEGDTYDIVSVINPRMVKEKLIITAIKRR
jgi:head-tail adaptor